MIAIALVGIYDMGDSNLVTSVIVVAVQHKVVHTLSGVSKWFKTEGKSCVETFGLGREGRLPHW